MQLKVKSKFANWSVIFQSCIFSRRSQIHDVVLLDSVHSQLKRVTDRQTDRQTDGKAISIARCLIRNAC